MIEPISRHIAVQLPASQKLTYIRSVRLAFVFAQLQRVRKCAMGLPVVDAARRCCQTALQPRERNWQKNVTKGDFAMSESSGDTSQPVIIKKYANRRLYNTASSSYVTLDHLCRMVKDGVDFVVYDAKTGEDITRSVLTQIIFEEESKGQNLLPIGFLRHLITFYDDSLRALVPSYLEFSMQTFARNQEKMRSYIQDTFGDLFPVNQLQDWGKQNIAMMQRAMNMFAPFAGVQNGSDRAPDQQTAAAADHGSQSAQKIAELQSQIEAMQRQIAALVEEKKRDQ